MKPIKLLNLAIALALVLGLGFGVRAAQAQGQTLTYESCFQVQNLESGQATINVDYYPQGSGSSISTSGITIAGNGSRTFCPLTSIVDGFNGSVVISSGQKIAAIANVTGAPGWTGYDASYAGFEGGATTVNLPLLMKGNFGYNTWFNVQNAGGTGTAHITISYSDGTSVTESIEQNRAKTFDQATENHSKTVFAATITSDQPIVVTVMEVGPTMLFGYNGFTSSTNNPIMPLVQANNYGFTSGVQIQNTGNNPTNVTVTYTPSAAGTACTQTISIPGKDSRTFSITAWDSGDNNANNNCVNGQTFIGSARVTTNSASQGLVAIVNQHNFATNKGAAYGSFDASKATNKVVFPLIMDRNYNYFTGFNVVNVGSGSATVNCTFSNSSVTASATLAQGQAMTHTQLNELTNGYVGSATCTAGAGAKIVGVANQLNNQSGGDEFLVYEAFSSQ